MVDDTPLEDDWTSDDSRALIANVLASSGLIVDEPVTWGSTDFKRVGSVFLVELIICII